ncbi:MAG: tetratricopeptide repeat protein [Sphingomonas sp.]|nr:tetratricopeptide repeat protein [Sphingomonas sp.]
MKLGIFALLVATPLSVPAVAHPTTPAAASDVRALNYTISYFQAALKRDNRDQEAWLNLGMAYRKLDRTADATTALRHVLALDNIVLQDRNGDDVWSHTLASQALADMQRTAAR